MASQDSDNNNMDDDQATPSPAPGGPRIIRLNAGSATLQALLGPLLQSAAAGGTTGMGGLTLSDLRQLLGSGDGGQGPGDDEDDEDYEDDDEGQGQSYFPFSRQSQPQAPRGGVYEKFFPPVTKPQDKGLELLYSGEFGRLGSKLKSRRDGLNVSREIRGRMSRARPTVYREDFTTSLVPNSIGTTVAEYDDNVYTAQYSTDSSFFYTCSQDFRLNIYDTSVPVVPRKLGVRNPEAAPNVKTNMKVMNSIQAHPGRWTIPDANLSPDNERMVYALLGNTCYVTSTTDPSPTQIPISFADPSTSRYSRWGETGFDGYRIYSCRFSADGNEVIGGGNGQIFVYDLLANRRTVKIDAHQDDVNSCCWADTSSGNVLVSASDDTYLKVWDRRSLGASQRPSGVLMGHTEGITYVSAKGDGRYVISNGKDQKLRLWDLRKMRTNQDLESCAHKNYSTNYDYRYPRYPKPRFIAHPKDCSVMTFYGHAVLRTLIRCHFSPAETTGGQYIYSGSADGKVHIWSLDGQVVQVLDRGQTLPMTFDPSDPDPEHISPSNRPCVRDVSWHAYEPVLMSAGWESGTHGGSRLARHEWKGLAKMRHNLEDWVARDRAHGSEFRRSARLAGRSPSLGLDDDDDEMPHIPGAYRVVIDDDDDVEQDDDDESDYSE